MRKLFILSILLFLSISDISSQNISFTDDKKEESNKCTFFLLKAPPQSEPNPKPLFEKHKKYIDELIANKTITNSGVFLEIGSYSGFIIVNEPDKTKASKILENDPGYNKLYSVEIFTCYKGT